MKMKMKTRFILTCLLFTLSFYFQEKKLEFYQTDRGQQSSWDTFFKKTKAADYMPILLYTRVPGVDQWKANVYIMKVLKERLNNLIQLRITLPIINTGLIDL